MSPRRQQLEEAAALADGAAKGLLLGLQDHEVSESAIFRFKTAMKLAAASAEGAMKLSDVDTDHAPLPTPRAEPPSFPVNSPSPPDAPPEAVRWLEQRRLW